MNPVDYIIIAVIGAILGFAAGYIVKAKKKGQKCIGCPDAASCPHRGNCGSCGGCGNRNEN